ncbi:MAG TPA: GNAT family N-acetyltransferase [Gammaproteobacteria bacterium]|nr:GNAT family N-acetyltransferase [Gammaproteobacteria bacterium]
MDRFRPAAEQDIDGIVEMMRQYYAEDGYPFIDAEARQSVRDLVRNDSLGRLWAIQDQNRVVGYLAVTLGFSLEYRGRDAFIDELYIVEKARAKGLGREALEIAEAYCRERGVKALHLEVERHRENAYELYRRTGFEDHDRRLMTKLLSRPES